VTTSRGQIPDDSLAQRNQLRRARTYLVFHASWANFTFCAAVSRVKGGTGGRISFAISTCLEFADGCLADGAQ